jgi:hexosaminidase
LTSVLETLAPLPLSARLGSYNYTTTTPFNRVVDAAVADPRAPHDLATLIVQLGDSAARAQVRAMLTGWKSASESLLQAASPDPRIVEAKPLLQNLADVAAVGLSALDRLDAGQPATADWRATQEPILTRAEQPAIELRSLVAPLVRKLADAAAVGAASTQAH